MRSSLAADAAGQLGRLLVADRLGQVSIAV